MRFGLVVVVMLLGGAQCQWTAQFPSDEVVRQINMNYLRQMMTNIMRNMGSPGPGYETLQPTQTAQPNPQTPSPQPTQPTTTPTPQRQSYLQTRHHRQKPKPQPRQFTLYDWIRANQILNPEFDITEMFGVPQRMLSRLLRGYGQRSKPFQPYQTMQAEGPYPAAQTESPYQTGQSASPYQSRQPYTPYQAEQPYYPYQSMPPYESALPYQSMVPPQSLSPYQSLMQGGAEIESPGEQQFPPYQTVQPANQSPSVEAIHPYQPDRSAINVQPTLISPTRTSNGHYYLGQRNRRRRPQRRRRPITLYNWIRANQMLNPEFDITEMFGGA